jgi:hypothetical protein
MPAGEYVIPFSGMQQIWDPIGDVSQCETVDTQTVCIEATGEVDARGRYTGTFVATFTGDVAGTLFGTMKGNVRGTDARPGRANARFQMEGDLTLLGQGPIRARATGTMRGEIDASGMFSGEVRERVCLRGEILGERVAGCERVEIPFVDEPEGVGDWTLALNVGPGPRPNTLEGTAQAQLASGALYLFTVSGRYNERTDESTLRFRVVNPDDRGASIAIRKLETAGALVAGGRMTYRIQGYSGRPDL